MRGTAQRTLLLGLVLLGVTACLTPSAADPIRTFQPPLARPDPGVSAADAPVLRLRNVAASSHLESRIAYRISETEFGFHETVRWTETPDRYVRRQLEAKLFPAPFQRTARADGPTLSIEVIAFEVTSRGSVEVAMIARLEDEDGRSLYEGTFAVEEKAPSDDLHRVAMAAGRALAGTVDQLIATLKTLDLGGSA